VIDKKDLHKNLGKEFGLSLQLILKGSFRNRLRTNQGINKLHVHGILRKISLNACL
jgi:hypothetical protein